MGFEEYQRLKNFPQIFITLCDYIGSKSSYSAGDKFLGVKKETICYSDFSIIDEHGQPHYYDGVILYENGIS